MNDWTRDLRHALRSLRRAPGFTAIAVLTLALGIGANTTMSSVLYGVLLRPLPYPDPDRLVQLAQTTGAGAGVMDVTYSQFRYLEERADVFADVAASTRVGFNLFGEDSAERVSGLRVSADYFRVLGVAPQLGRAFAPEEDTPGGPPVVILSHGVWARQFGSDPSIIGRPVRLDGVPHTVVGIMPAGFRSLRDVDVWSTVAPVGATIGSGQNLDVIGRLPAGLSLEAARARMGVIGAALQEEFRQSLPGDIAIDLMPIRTLVASDARGPVRILAGAIGFVLLIACANVANLLLGRASGRAHEMAVRVALGASRWRLMRQVLAESLVLALAGGAVGLVFAGWALPLLVSLAPFGLATADIHVDRWALGFTAVASLATGGLFGALPAWQTARTDPYLTLKESSRRAGGSGRQGKMRSGLVVAEVALSLMLLVGAGLLIRTFANLLHTDPGFDTDRLVAAEIWLTGSEHESTASIGGFYAEVVRRLEALPEVEQAGVVEAGLPLIRGGNMPFALDGLAPRAAAEYRTVTPSYLRVLGVPLQEGRLFAEADREGGEPVAIVNRAFVRGFMEGGDALGRTVRLGGTSNDDRRIVGVVGDLRSFVGRPAGAAIFIPSAQTPAGFTRVFSSWFPINVVARTAGDPAPVRAALAQVIRETDPQVPVGRVRTMTEILSGSLATQRFLMVLLSLFGGLAIALAAVGIYGVMAYFTAQRTHEIGVRLALGAQPGDVVRLVLRRGVFLTAVGTGLGLAGAVALTRLLGNQLYEVGTVDPLTFAVVSAGIVLLALAACALPARRAARLDPVEALRHE